MSAPYQYIVLHQSCRNHPGVLACQAAHAAGESIRSLPVSPETVVCALVADKSEDLEQLAVRLNAAGIEHVIIREPDAPYNGAATAVGISPTDRELVRAHVAGFRVFRGGIAGAADKYATVIHQVREVARAHGYAIGVHGSGERDLDLIAVPWTDEATAADVLVEAIRVAVGGFIINRADAKPNDYTKRNPEPKPHGRLAWSIHLGGGPYIDLSVILPFVVAP